MSEKTQTKKIQQARLKTDRNIEKDAVQSEPSIDVAEVKQRYKDLQDWLNNYQPDYDEPDRRYLGPVLNRLWRLNRALNPRNLPHGHLVRDDALKAAKASEQAMLHKIRNKADGYIALFQLEAVINKDDIQSIIREVCKRIQDNGDELPLLRDGYSQIHPPAKWVKVFEVECFKTIKRRMDQGQYKAIRIDEKNWRFRIADIPKEKRDQVC